MPRRGAKPSAARSCVDDLSRSDPHYDAAVIGAGFGGLGAALRLAERGARVLLCERLNYPGGCASTIRHRGYRFEAGATLFSGLGPDQLFGRWITAHRLPVVIDWIDPLVTLQTPELQLTVPRQRTALCEQLCAVPGAPVAGLRTFFAQQATVADALWSLLDDPSLLPPFSVPALLRHALRLPRYVPLLGVVGRSLTDVLRGHGLADFEPLRIYLNALCQITVQCSAAEAEAPFALGTMDYYYRGTGHVRGGIGALASALVDAIRAAGGTVELSCAVHRVTRDADGWQLDTRHGTRRAAHVVANLLPQDLERLVAPIELPTRIRALAGAVERGWGACMLYLVIDGDGMSPDAHHLQLVHDPKRPFQEGNHVFCSISGAHDTGRAPEGQRTVTVSTHVPLEALRDRPSAEQQRYVDAVHERMRATIAAVAPALHARVQRVFTASPRTFERFTGRALGAVGGIPRRRAWSHYLSAFDGPLVPGLQLVGDSIFPGQSTLAAALGGVRAAERVR